MLTPWKRELTQKCEVTLIYFYICHRMAPLRMLYSVVTLTYIFKITQFEM